MPVPLAASRLDKPAKSETETSDRRWLDDFRAREFAPTAQIVLSWDGTALRAEGPGKNGAREKIEGISFDALQPALQAALIEQQADRARATEHAAKIEIKRADPEIERRLRNEKIAAERARQWNEYLDSLLPAERERQIALKVQRDEREAQRRLENAKSVWWTMAGRKNQGVDFADKMIPEGRRPRRAKAKVKTTKARKIPTGGIAFDLGEE
jgi:hypothetical protein